MDLAILGLLRETDLHGYEIRKRLGEILGPIARLSFGTLYPALNRLEKDGAVRVVDVTKSRTRLTTERGRKIYTLTEDGTELFNELLEAGISSSSDDKTFVIRMAFARYLPREARLRFLVRRREQLQAQLEESRQAFEDNVKSLDSYRRSLMEHGNDMRANEIAWLDSMISQEQQVSPTRATNP